MEGRKGGREPGEGTRSRGRRPRSEIYHFLSYLQQSSKMLEVV